MFVLCFHLRSALHLNQNETYKHVLKINIIIVNVH